MSNLAQPPRCQDRLLRIAAHICGGNICCHTLCGCGNHNTMHTCTARGGGTIFGTYNVAGIGGLQKCAAATHHNQLSLAHTHHALKTCVC